MRLRKELIIPLSILAGIALGTTSATGYADSTPTNQETNANIQAEQSMEQNPTDVVNSEQKDELVDNQATNEEEQQAPQDDLTVSTAKAAHPGWNQDQYGWSYYRNNGTYLRNQWQWINGNWYLFTNDGYMAANGIYYAPNNTDMYCFNGDGHYLTNTWFRYSSWRYAKSDGILASDWQKINSHWYYFDPTNAWAVTNWQRINGRWYYFDSNNAWALENWQKINGRWYYFDSNNAWADSGWQLIDGKWYYFDPTNAWADTGWQKINNHWYYFDPENCWALLGIQKINGCWYYLDPVDAWMYTGTQTINGKQFTFATDGKYTGQSDLSKERRYNPETKEMETPVNGYLIYWTERGGYADDPHSSDQVQKQILVTPYPKIKLTPVYIDKAKKVYNYTYNIPEWVDTDYSDYNTKVETDGHGHITGESAKVAAIFAAQIINYMRKQIGSIPVKVSQESIAANYDAAKLNDDKQLHFGNHDKTFSEPADLDYIMNNLNFKNKLATYIMNKYDSQNGAAISESDAGNIEDYTLADLKDAVYYDITGWILEDGNLDNYPGHRWQMLGIADCDATNSPDPYVGINFSKIDGTHLSIFINPRNEAAQHVILFEQ